jgi:starch synthase (maltosyl-transferring)
MESMTTLTALHHLRQRLRQKMAESFPNYPYAIPGRWLGIERAPMAVSIANPYRLWLEQVDAILSEPSTPCCGQQTDDWTTEAVAYNLLVRNGTAFDHDGDGILGRPNPAGFSETGTFVKSLLLLPYIRALGCNTIHLLPITAVGRDQRKGVDGSPYAVRNQYRLDENLAEPSLELGAEAEFAAFVEAAHHLGLRVVMEFIFRTASRDADWVQTHPHWFYWIDAAIPERPPDSRDETEYGMPLFSEVEGEQILQQIEQRPYTNMLPPSAAYRAMFLPPPRPEEVMLDENGRWLARYEDGRYGRIPGAFSDWPLDRQPPWPDVTYLRLYDHPDFNYMAYNTLRYYDERLARPQQQVPGLWQQIVGIIPHYQRQFGIDGAMVDMGHALPRPLVEQIITATRRVNPAFAFWKENFTIAAESREEGYNAVIGSLLFELAETAAIRAFLSELAEAGTPIPFFGAPESHNSPRAAARPGGPAFVRYGAALASFLPALPFVHNGVEFGETQPVNTGVGFTPEEHGRFTPNDLPLFTTIPFNWTTDPDNLTAYWQRTLHLHRCYQPLLRRSVPGSLQLVESSDNIHIQALIRMDRTQRPVLALVVNHDCHQFQKGTIYLPTHHTYLTDQYSGASYSLHRAITFQPGQALWFDFLSIDNNYLL